MARRATYKNLDAFTRQNQDTMHITYRVPIYYVHVTSTHTFKIPQKLVRQMKSHIIGMNNKWFLKRGANLNEIILMQYQMGDTWGAEQNANLLGADIRWYAAHAS